MPIVEFQNVSRIYKSGDHVQRALDNVSFNLDEGKFVVILGPSGAGVLYWLQKALASEYELKIIIGPVTYIVSILLTFGVSLIVGFMVTRKNKKINMVEALKNAE